MRHPRYLSPSHTAHARATTPTSRRSELSAQPSPSSWPSTRIRMIASGMPVRMLREKYHQCGRRSRATVSPSWIRLSGYAIAERLRLRPAQFVEARVVHAEVVADLVEDRDPHLRGELVDVASPARDRALEDGDAVGRHTVVAERTARRERHAFVETEQRAPGTDARELRGCGPVLDHHRDVLELAREGVGDLVERVADHAFELRSR